MCESETVRLKVLHARVRRAQSGDAAARDQLFAQFSRFLLRACARGNPGDREDAPGDAFLVLDQLVRDYRWEHRVPFDAYVFVLGPCRIRAAVRKQRHAPITPPAMEEFIHSGTDTPSCALEEAILVRDLLAQLPPAHRHLLWLHACGHTFEEIGSRMGIPPAAFYEEQDGSGEAARSRLPASGLPFPWAECVDFDV